MWQEFIFSIGAVMFTIALIPTMLSTNKPPVSTAAITGGILYAYAFTFSTLDLTFSAVTTLVTAIAWTIIVFQR